MKNIATLPLVILATFALSQTALADPLPDLVEDIAQAYANSDAAALGALYANDATLESPAFPGPLSGRNAIVSAEAFLMSAFCDLSWVPTEVVSKHDAIAVQYVLSGQFCGPFPSRDGTSLMQPTFRHLSLKLATFIQTGRHNEIVRETRYADIDNFYDQLEQN